MVTPALSRLCSTREFAQLRGISRQRVLALLDAGRIVGAQWIGTRWAIPRGARVAPPARIAVFGSRVRGGSRADSDLDVAVFMTGREDRALRRAIYAAAAEAAAALEGSEPALLQPSVIFAASARTGFVDIVEREGRPWTS